MPSVFSPNPGSLDVDVVRAQEVKVIFYRMLVICLHIYLQCVKSHLASLLSISIPPLAHQHKNGP